MPSSCAQCMVTKGKDSTLGSGAQGVPWGQHPKAFLWRMLGGGWCCTWRVPSPPFQSATTQQCSTHSAQGQDKGEHPPVSCCQNWSRASPKTSSRKSLRSCWDYLEGVDKRRPGDGQGWWRLSGARPPSEFIGRMKISFSYIAVTRPSKHLLEKHHRAPCLHSQWSRG